MAPDAALLRALILARLNEHPEQTLSRAAVADIVKEVVVEVGLLPPDVHTPGGVHPGTAAIIVAETLRINAPLTNSFSVLATAVLDALTANGFDYATATPRSAQVHLSPKQREVIKLASAGLTYPEMALVLGLTQGTVNIHMEKARSALGARNTPHAIAIAARLGILDEAARAEQAAA